MHTKYQLVFFLIFSTSLVTVLHEAFPRNWGPIFAIGIPAALTGIFFIRRFFLSNNKRLETLMQKPNMKTAIEIIFYQKKRKE